MKCKSYPERNVYMNKEMCVHDNEKHRDNWRSKL